MSIAAPPHVDLAEWETTWSLDEDAYELVAGVPTMTPPEAGININAASLLHERLTPLIRASHRVLWNYGVHLRTPDGRDTVREPDLVVLPRHVDITRSYIPAADATLVVEVVSPSSIERDWVAKRADYASAGIPNYLVADVRGKDPHLWLFDTIVAGAYVDPTGDGASVTLRIPCYDPITITASDLR